MTKAVSSLCFIVLVVLGQSTITEFIDPFNLPVDDLNLAVSKQLSRSDFQTTNFTSPSKVAVSDLVYQCTYDGSQRVVEPEVGPEHKVVNDSMRVKVTYNAKLGTKKVKGTTTLKVYVDYEKSISEDEGASVIGDLAVRIDLSSFNMTYEGSVSDADKTKLQEVNKGQKNTSIYILLSKQQFSIAVIRGFFRDNLVAQQISPTYSPTEQYQFNPGVNITLDMRTLRVEPLGETGIEHIIKASINGYNSDAFEFTTLSEDDLKPIRQGQFHTLLPFDFITNFLNYNIDYNSNWRKHRVERGSSYRTRTFKFRLMDLDAVFPGIAAKYPKYYINDIALVCSPINMSKPGIDEVSDRMDINIYWRCEVQLSTDTNTPLVISQMEALMTYVIDFEVSNDRLNVFCKNVYLQKYAFKGELQQPKNTKLFRAYANEIIYFLTGYKPGTGFKIKQSSTQVRLKQNVGIYIR